MFSPLSFRQSWVAAGMLALLAPAAADQHVSVHSNANPEYTQRKYGGAKPAPETYVFMQGKYFDGYTVDHSIERMPFRRIAELLAPELARQQYVPTKDFKTADLLLVVHWGTTNPKVTIDQMRAVTTRSVDTGLDRETQQQNATQMAGPDIGMLFLLNVADEGTHRIALDQEDLRTDRLDGDLLNATNAQLLGYGEELRRLQGSGMFRSEAEATLLSDLADERYFIIIKAYDLRAQGQSDWGRRPVWTVHLNIRSPGHNFPTALNLMGTVASDYFGRTSDGVLTRRATVREGKVTLAPLVILGEVK